MIHEQLLKDCHQLGQMSSGALLLHRNAALAWFILVPDTAALDLLDLPAQERDAVVADCALVSRFLKQELGFEKVNFAGLGNQVPQMHLHIIGRRSGDPCWPRPVWGNLDVELAYEESRVRHWQASLAAAGGLRPRQD